MGWSGPHWRITTELITANKFPIKETYWDISLTPHVQYSMHPCHIPNINYPKDSYKAQNRVYLILQQHSKSEYLKHQFQPSIVYDNNDLLLNPEQRPCQQ